MQVAVMAVLVGVAGLSTAGALLGGVDTAVTESTCQSFCQLIPSSAAACKDFTRALPRPKLGRTCTQKFGEGWAFACPLLCSRLTDGMAGHVYPWVDGLTHYSCQEMSGHIPYPAVFNSCKTGFRTGINAANAAVSKQFRTLTRPEERRESPNHRAEDTKHQHLPHGGETSAMADAALASIPVETGAQAVESGSGETLGEDADAWMEALETLPDYVDYATVAKERVSAARKTRGSDLKRGPACPVCSG